VVRAALLSGGFRGFQGFCGISGAWKPLFVCFKVINDHLASDKINAVCDIWAFLLAKLSTMKIKAVVTFFLVFNFQHDMSGTGNPLLKFLGPPLILSFWHAYL